MGWIIFFIGIIIRFFAIRSLGKNVHWRIVPPKETVKRGLYRYIRHPMYLGGLFDYTGFFWIITGSPAIALCLFTILLNFTLDRIDREEKELLFWRGKEYQNYMKQTKMLIPFIF